MKQEKCKQCILKLLRLVLNVINRPPPVRQQNFNTNKKVSTYSTHFYIILLGIIIGD
jgi:cytochrome b561